MSPVLAGGLFEPLDTWEAQEFPFPVLAGFNNSLPKNRVWKGEKCNFTVEKTGRHHLNQIIKINITYVITWLTCTPWYNACFTSPVFSPKPLTLLQNNKIEEHSIKFLTRTPFKTVKVIKRRRNLSQTRGDEEDMTNESTVVSWIGAEKDISKNWWNPNSLSLSQWCYFSANCLVLTNIHSDVRC